MKRKYVTSQLVHWKSQILQLRKDIKQIKFEQKKYQEILKLHYFDVKTEIIQSTLQKIDQKIILTQLKIITFQTSSDCAIQCLRFGSCIQDILKKYCKFCLNIHKHQIINEKNLLKCQKFLNTINVYYRNPLFLTLSSIFTLSVINMIHNYV